MDTPEALATLQRVLGADPDVVDRDELTDLVRSSARLRALLDGFDVRCSRRARELADAGKAEAPSSLLGRNGNRSGREARKIGRREHAGRQMPTFEAAMGSGEVSAEHLDVIANVGTGVPDDVRLEFNAHEAELLDAARTETVEAFTRRCRDLIRRITADLAGPDENDAAELDRQRNAANVKRWTDQITGMCHTHLELDPVRDAEVWSAIDAHITRIRTTDTSRTLNWAQLQVQAVVDAISAGVTTDDDTEDIDDDDEDIGDATGDTGDIGDDARDNEAPTAADTDDPTGHNHRDGDRWGDGDLFDIGGGRDTTADAGTTATTAPHEAAPTAPEATTGTSAIAKEIGAQLAATIAARTPAADTPTADTARRIARRPRPAQRVPEITVLVGLDVLMDGTDALGNSITGICETIDGRPLPVSTVRRMCCDADIIPAVLAGNGEVTDLGRSRRTANRAQRRQLAAMHRTCAHPDCTVGFTACRIHHVKWWWRDLGATDIANLLPLCEQHHHLVHEGGWGLALDAGRTATWTRPDGTTWHTGPTIDRPPTTARPRRRVA